MDHVYRIFVKFGDGITISDVDFKPPEKLRNDELKLRLRGLNFNEKIYYRTSEDMDWKSVSFRNLDNEDPLEMYDPDNGETINWTSYAEIFSFSQYKLSREQQFAVAQSFAAKLTYSGKVQSTLIIQYICRISSSFGQQETTMYAPYGVLCQSSGFGKSRSASEVGRRLATIYGVFRKPSDSGYPHKSKWLTSISDFIDEASNVDFEGNTDKEARLYKVGRALMFFHCLVDSYFEWFKSFLSEDLAGKCFNGTHTRSMLSREELITICEVFDKIINEFTGGSGKLEQFTNILEAKKKEAALKKDSIFTVRDSLIELTKKFKSINEQVFKQREAMDREEWAPFIQSHFKPEDTRYGIWPTNCSTFPFVIILDEASLLAENCPAGEANKLTIIRRALHFLTSTDSLVVISLGTNCDVSVLSKPMSDNSLRIVTRPNLFYPLIVTGNNDIHATESKLQDLVIDRNFVLNRRTALLKCSFGRPLWNSLNLATLINAAVAKIRNCSNDPFTSFIATWCIRVGLSVNASSKISERLLSSHMATLLASSSNGGRIIVNYSAEPVLALAARAYISQVTKAYFESLLKFVEGVPTDRGRIGESILGEVLLQARDRAEPLDESEYISDLNPAGSSERVRQILRTREFILEDKEKTGGTSVDHNDPNANFSSSDMFCTESFRPTNVKKFLTSLYSSNVFQEIEGFLPPPLLNGILNFAQFVTLHREFPLEEFFPNEEIVHVSDATGELKKKCDIFDRAMSKLGLLKDIAFVCPFGYYGLDAVIPVLIEVDVEVQKYRNGNLHEKLYRPGSGSKRLNSEIGADNVGDDVDDVVVVSIEIVKKSVQSFIGVQYKVGHAEKSEAMAKAAPWLHFNRERDYELWEREAIEDNYLVLVLSSANDFEKEKVSVVAPGSAFKAKTVKHFSDPKLADAASRKDAFYRVPSSFDADCATGKVEEIAKIRLPKSGINEANSDVNAAAAASLLKPSVFTSVKVAPHVSVCAMYWPEKKKKFTCIWSASLSVFQPLLGSEIIKIAHQIMRHDRPVFSNQIDRFVRKTLADATLNTQTAFFPGIDPHLHAFRGRKRLPPVLENFDHWLADFVINPKINDQQT